MKNLRGFVLMFFMFFGAFQIMQSQCIYNSEADTMELVIGGGLNASGVCFDSNVTIIAMHTGTDDTVDYEYDWLVDGESVVPDFSSLNLSSVTSTFTVTLELSDGDGFICSITEQITVFEMMSVNLQVDSLDGGFCTADTLILSSMINGGSGVYNSFLYGIDNDTISTSDTTALAFDLDAGNYNFWVDINDSAGCNANDTLEVQVFQTPELNLPDTIGWCNNGIGQIEYSEVDIDVDCIWTTSTGDEILNLDTIINPVNTDLNGFHVFSCTSSISGCASIDSVEVTVLDYSIGAFADDDPSLLDSVYICQGYNLMLGILDTTNTSIYSWTTDSFTLDDETLPFPELSTEVEAGEYLIFINTEHNFGCQAMDSIRVFILPQLDAIGSTLTVTPEFFCVDNEIVVSAVIPEEYNFLNIEYAWTVDGISTVLEVNSITIGSPIDSMVVSVEINFIDDSTYGCLNSETWSLEINPLPIPTPSLSLFPSQICEGQPVYILSSYGNGELTWDFGDIDQFHIIENIDEYTIIDADIILNDSIISITETLDSGCAGSTSIVLDIQPSSATNEPAEIVPIAGTDILIYNDSSPECYLWSYYDTELDSVIKMCDETYQSYVPDEYQFGDMIFCQAWNGDCGCDPICPATSVFQEFVSISELGQGQQTLMKAFPNPNDGLFQLEFSNLPKGLEYEIVIYDIWGRIVFNQDIQLIEKYNSIDLRQNEPGLYLIQLYQENNLFYSTPVIVSQN